MRRRTDFEHRIASRATRAKDFLRYAEYEMNVEKLRLKRVARLGKEATEAELEADVEAAAAEEETGAKRERGQGRGVSSYAGPRRVFFIFERGTKKYPNEIAALWLPYLRFAKAQGAVFVLARIHSRMLQLHPTNPAVWILAAKYQLDEHAAIRSARSIMQRGLRFNATNAAMWLEYMKLELIYIAQLLARRRVLGLVTESQQRKDAQYDADDVAKTQKDVIEMPTFDNDLEQRASAELKSLPDVDVNMLGDVSTNPALRGDIALLVFDSALPELVRYTKDPAEKQKLLLRFGDDALAMITEFCLDKTAAPSAASSAQLDGIYLGTHIIDSVSRSVGSAAFPPASIAFWTTVLPVRYLSPSSAAFPDAVKALIDSYTKTHIKSVYAKAPQKLRIEYAGLVADYLKARFIPHEEEEDDEQGLDARIVDELDPNLALILRSLIAKCDTQQ